MRYTLIQIAAGVCVLAGCQPDVTAPENAKAPPTLAFGKSTVQIATATWKLPLNTSGLGLISDGQFSDGTSSVYDDGVCGVTTRIFNATGSGSGDATLQTNNPTAKANGCAQYPRKMSIVYPAGDPQYSSGGTETMAVFLNVRNIANPTTVIPIGYANRVQRHFAVNPSQATRCDAWRWSSDLSSDDVWVERMDVRTYHVYTKDRDPDPVVAALRAGENRATCTTTGVQHRLSVDFLIVAKQDMPL